MIAKCYASNMVSSRLSMLGVEYLSIGGFQFVELFFVDEDLDNDLLTCAEPETKARTIPETDPVMFQIQQRHYSAVSSFFRCFS